MSGLGDSGVGHSKCLGWALQRVSGVGQSRQNVGLGVWVGHFREFLGLGTPQKKSLFWSGALQGDSGVGHSGRLWEWALQVSGLGVSGVGHCRKTPGLALGTPSVWVWHFGSLCGWALQGDSGVGHSRDSGSSLGWALSFWGWALQETLGLGTPRRLWGWALQVSGFWVGHFRESLGLGTPGDSGVGHSKCLGWAPVKLTHGLGSETQGLSLPRDMLRFETLEISETDQMSPILTASEGPEIQWGVDVRRDPNLPSRSAS